MTRVSPIEQPLTLAEYESLDSAGKKKNLFIRLLKKYNEQEAALISADKAIGDANGKIDQANRHCFAGNSELNRALSLNSDLECDNRELLSELARIKSKWYFKLFGK